MKPIWRKMTDAPKDGTRILVAYNEDFGPDFVTAIWVENYGCPGWRGGGTFIYPFAWMEIPPVDINVYQNN